MPPSRCGGITPSLYFDPVMTRHDGTVRSGNKRTLLLPDLMLTSVVSFGGDPVGGWALEQVLRSWPRKRTLVCVEVLLPATAKDGRHGD